MKLFKPSWVMVSMADGVKLARANEHNSKGIFCSIGRHRWFVPNENVVEWING